MNFRNIFRSEDESKKEIVSLKVGSPVTGEVISLEALNDEAFSRGLVGQGIALIPADGTFVSPIDGTIVNSGLIKHAVAVKNENGLEVLIHIGLETVKLNGQHFERLVEADQVVKKGDPLVIADLDAIKEAGYDLTTPVVITKLGAYSSIEVINEKEVKSQEELIVLNPLA